MLTAVWTSIAGYTERALPRTSRLRARYLASNISSDATHLRHIGATRHETQRGGRARRRSAGGLERRRGAHPARGGARDVDLDGARGGEQHAHGHGRRLGLASVRPRLMASRRDKARSREGCAKHKSYTLCHMASVLDVWHFCFRFSAQIMRLSAGAVIAVACAAVEAAASTATGSVTCSSLNGPFCAGFGSQFAVAPLHAMQNLDVDEEVRPWNDGTVLGAAMPRPCHAIGTKILTV